MTPFLSGVLAKLVYFRAAEQVPPGQQPNQTNTWQAVGKGKATDESERGHVGEEYCQSKLVSLGAGTSLGEE